MRYRIDRKNYGYKLVESLDNADDKDVYEEYIFVERRKYGMLFSLRPRRDSILILARR